jgi:DNA-binding MarR family transcriptional regulator
MRQQAETDLTPTKLAHLATIDREGPMSLGDLACAERVTAPTVTKVVRELEALDLVVREVDDADKRVSLVRVTPLGAQTITASRTRKDAWLTEQLADLSAAELESLEGAVAILERLTEPGGN